MAVARSPLVIGSCCGSLGVRYNVFLFFFFFFFFFHENFVKLVEDGEPRLADYGT